MKLINERLLSQVAFIHEIDKLKYIQRKTKLFNSERQENDAEHSWHLAMMTIVLAEHSNEKVDVMKVLKMVLIHDIVEIDAGDIFLYDNKLNHTNTEAERLAAERIFGLLPKDQAEEFISIWEEFEAGVTEEAKFARSMDRLEPLLQNVSNNGGTWREYNVEYSRVYKTQEVIRHGSQTIWDHARPILESTLQKITLRKAG
ncbi:MAG: HD domain-containing protein [Bacteroidetes bacterium]|nr:HD domain-containing protein [Bacteroidota bacterium]